MWKTSTAITSSYQHFPASAIHCMNVHDYSGREIYFPSVSETQKVVWFLLSILQFSMQFYLEKQGASFLFTCIHKCKCKMEDIKNVSSNC